MAEWTLHHVGGDAPVEVDGVPATVPGCVHTDLLAAGLIPDPFVDANELAVAWVAGADWEYRTVLDFAAVADRQRAELVFHGLDTLATVTLDGEVVAETENMHRTYRVDVTGRRGRTPLAVRFRSATREAEARREREGDWPSSSFGRPFNYVRKMACSWGWDWGPWLTTAGIWRPVEVVGWDGARLASVRPVVTVEPDDTGSVTVHLRLDPTSAEAVAVHATLAGPDGAEIATASSEAARDASLTLTPGRVERWWPHGHGDQPRYRLTVTVTGEGGTTLNRWERAIGFRTVVLDTAPDRTGSAFTFVVNGRPMFARGVNWIPDDPFPSRVTPARYRARLERAVAAGADLVRVWGGGIYEDDAFYDACDELGLLVWQDFPFACAAYPEALLAAEVEAEARDNVERLMVHPSLALWNGNNENIWGWFDWEWQDRLGGRPWGLGFYFKTLPSIVVELDPGRPYWPGSPYSGSMSVAPNADAPVVAVNDGRVVKLGKSKRLGRYVMLQDVYGNTYTYAHLGEVSRTYPAPKPRSARRGKEKERTPTRNANVPREEAAEVVEPAVAAAPLPLKERLFAHPTRPEARAAGGDVQLAAAGDEATQDAPLGFDARDFRPKALKKGSRVLGGTILGRLGERTKTSAPYLKFEIRPAGRGAPRIDPKPILDGWKLLESTAIYRAKGKNPFFGADAADPSIGQLLLLSKEQLVRRVLADRRIEIYGCGQGDIRSGQIDRRVLATLLYLAGNGLKPTVTSLKCGHGRYTSSGNVSHHSTGTAVDIGAINGIVISPATQGPGSITDLTIQRLLKLQGTMKPSQIISLMTFEGADNTLSMGDHDDHIHVGWQPLYGENRRAARQIDAVLQPEQWIKLIDRLGDIDNPTVREQPSRYSVKVVKRASKAHRGE